MLNLIDMIAAIKVGIIHITVGMRMLVSMVVGIMDIIVCMIDIIVGIISAICCIIRRITCISLFLAVGIVGATVVIIVDAIAVLIATVCKNVSKIVGIINDYGYNCASSGDNVCRYHSRYNSRYNGYNGGCNS